jgi:N-acetyl-anhydromuramyl-L-alanine amidase AmpD
VNSIFTFEDCRKYHKSKGWRDIGYHFYIERNGELHTGRDVSDSGAHTKGQNTQSIGVCYEGTRFPAVIQIDTLINLYRTIKSTYHLGVDDWYGHYQFKNKDCPGFPIEDLHLIFRKVSI